MEEKIKIVGLAILCIGLMMMVSFCGGWSLRSRQMQTPTHDTVRIEHWDTTYLQSPPDTVTLTYTKTVQVPFYVVDTDTIVDSVWVSLPYEQHFARLDTVADVWFSGYDAKIDSARVYKSTITNYIYVREKQRNNLVGVSAGLNDAALLYMYDFGKLAVGASAGYTYEGQPTARAVVGIKF